MEAIQPVSTPGANAQDARPAQDKRREQVRAGAVRAGPSPAAEVPRHSLSVHMDRNKRVYYQVVDDRTGEVIRRVPPEEIRRVARNAAELLKSNQGGSGHKVNIDL